MDIIYCAGGNKRLAKIAIDHGFLYGARSDDIRDIRCNGLIDVNWKDYVWDDHFSAIKKHKPKYAVVPDIYDEDDLQDLLDQGKQVEDLGTQVIAVPKSENIVNHIPNNWIIGVSVPSSYAGFLPNISELQNRKVHLLGGSPGAQRDLWNEYKHSSITIVSVDINSHNKASDFGTYWNGNVWKNTQKDPIGKYEAFRLSCAGIMKMWKELGSEINHAK